MRAKKLTLTAKAKYALKALEYLAALQAVVTREAIEISHANGIPKPFLDTILRDLQAANVIERKKGRKGGHKLARPPGEIVVGDVIRAIDGPLSPLVCASGTGEACDDCKSVETCRVAAVLIEVCSAVSAVVDTISLEEMAALARTPTR